jgi:hypothetical protein
MYNKPLVLIESPMIEARQGLSAGIAANGSQRKIFRGMFPEKYFPMERPLNGKAH